MAPSASDDESVSDLEQFLDEAASEPREATSDVGRIVDLLDHDQGVVRRLAGHALLEVARVSRSTVEEPYPDAVDALVATDETLWLAEGLIHGAVSLLRLDVTDRVIVEGYWQALKQAHEELSDIATSTGDTDDSEVPGNGATATELAVRLHDHADGVEGREELVVDAFADGLEILVNRRARDLGADPVDTLVDLGSFQAADGPLTRGLVESGDIEDVLEAGETVPVDRFEQALVDAAHVAMLVVVVEPSVAQVLRVQAALAERMW
jgi:chaperonin GroEL (HSP60 family)